MIISLTDFNERPYRIPNQNESPDLSSFLAAEEMKLAVKYLLGYDLWIEFTEALEASGPLDTKWEELLNGAEYTYGDDTYYYAGWADMVKPALYALWIPQGTWKFTNIGYVENNAPQQSVLMDDPSGFIVSAWNDFVNKAGFDYHCHTFYGFMKSKNTSVPETYPSWKYNQPPLKNRFGF